jgi:hypothetical protein
MHIIGEGVAPTVERWTPNPTVVGSNPIALTFLVLSFKLTLSKIYYIRIKTLLNLC